MKTQPRLVYSPHYNIRFGGLEKLHPFDSCKFGRAFAVLRKRGIAADSRIEPAPVCRDELLLVHTPAYLEQLKRSSYVAQVLELPILASLPSGLIEKHVLRPMRYASGGTLCAAGAALAGRIAVNLGGGYHHASRDRGQGFCVYADIPIAVAALRARGQASKVLIVDLDAHQGNGFERIFASDPQTKILDMYNAENFPFDQPARRAITWDVPLAPGTADGEYLARLKATLPLALGQWRADLAFFIAGTDVVATDPLGGLALSADGVFERDRLVFEQLSDHGVCWVMVLGGGYTRQSYRLVARSVAYVFARFG
jgi:histone deacetylase 11